jgi:hypothetical protein
VYPVGSGYGPVAGSCEYDNEPSGSGATELVFVKNQAALTDTLQEGLCAFSSLYCLIFVRALNISNRNSKKECYTLNVHYTFSSVFFGFSRHLFLCIVIS